MKILESPEVMQAIAEVPESQRERAKLFASACDTVEDAVAAVWACHSYAKTAITKKPYREQSSAEFWKQWQKRLDRAREVDWGYLQS